MCVPVSVSTSRICGQEACTFLDHTVYYRIADPANLEINTAGPVFQQVSTFAPRTLNDERGICQRVNIPIFPHKAVTIPTYNQMMLFRTRRFSTKLRSGLSCLPLTTRLVAVFS